MPDGRFTQSGSQGRQQAAISTRRTASGDISQTSSHSATVDPSVVNYGHQQPGPPLSFEQELTSVDALFQSADPTFGIVSLFI